MELLPMTVFLARTVECYGQRSRGVKRHSGRTREMPGWRGAS
jgi:hypothetical protein